MLQWLIMCLVYLELRIIVLLSQLSSGFCMICCVIKIFLQLSEILSEQTHTHLLYAECHCSFKWILSEWFPQFWNSWLLCIYNKFPQMSQTTTYSQLWIKQDCATWPIVNLQSEKRLKAGRFYCFANVYVSLAYPLALYNAWVHI